MKKVITYFASHGMITNWIILLVVAAGAFGLTQLRRRVWPEIEYNWITVNTSWPDASAREVEGSLTRPIEAQLNGLEGVSSLESSTFDGGLSISIEANPALPVKDTIDRIRTTLRSITGLPKEASSPTVKRQRSWNRVMLLAIYGTEDMDRLQTIAADFRGSLLRTGKVSRIVGGGLLTKEIVLEFSPAMLQARNIAAADIVAAVRAAGVNAAAGSVKTGTETLAIRSYAPHQTVEAIARIPIRVGNDTLLLGEICEVREQWPEDAFYARVNGKPAVNLSIMYTNSEDVLTISEAADALIAESSARYGDDITIEPMIRESDQIKERLGTLRNSGLMGLLLVVLVLGVFLNLRLSIWVAFGIPFSFLGLFFMEWLLGITINEMSLFGMIMVLGILVDDGIVIGENIWTHWKMGGKDPLRAAIDGTREVIVPVIVSIVTTMVAFAPYFFLYGDLGQYTGQIAMVVILCLAFSLIEAAVILPVHLAHSKALSNRPGGPGASESRLRRGLDRFQEGLINRIYAPILKAALMHRGFTLALMASALLVITGALAGGHVKMAFFPDVEIPYTFAEVSFPSGTSGEVMNRVRDGISRQAMELGREPEWTNPDRGYDSGVLNVVSWGGGQNVSIFIIMIPNDARKYSPADFGAALNARLDPIPEAEKVKVGDERVFGDYPISVRFMGEDARDLHRAAEMLKEELTRIDGVKDIAVDTSDGTKELVFNLNTRGRTLGLTTPVIANQIRDAWRGREITRVTAGSKRIPVILRVNPAERRSLNQLDRFPIRTPSKKWVLTGDVIDYRIDRGSAEIRRENGSRMIGVDAGLDDSANSLNVVLSEVSTKIVPRILSRFPSVSVSAGGQADDTKRMAKSMTASMAAALIIMFTILMIAAGSPGQAFLIIALIPMGLVGAVFGHLIVGIPLSFLSFLGVVALAGIIVNDSVVFIACYNNLIRQGGVSPRRAAFRTGLRRFRPILLTTITTAAGVAPLIFQTSEGGQFLIPIAVSMAFGLIFGTFLTLVLLPCVLTLMGDSSRRRLNEKRRRPLVPAAEAAMIASGGME